MSEETPILFKDEMVRAIFADLKDQTRRLKGLEEVNKATAATKEATTNGDVVKLDKVTEDGVAHFSQALGWCQIQQAYTFYMTWEIPCPYGKPGDFLWVREAWQVIDADPSHLGDHAPGDELTEPMKYGVVYRADGEDGEAHWHTAPKGKTCLAVSDPFVGGPWRPNIHMFRWACRLRPLIKSIRMERVQDISEADAIAEGVESIDVERDEPDFSICPQCGGTRLYTSFIDGGACPDTDCLKCDTHKKRFANLWDSINGEKSPWARNDWVWVVEFERKEA